MRIKNKEITAAIFDMDGTMFDTERLRMKMLKQASLEQYGKTIPEQLLFDSLGLSSVSAKQLSLQEFGPNYPYESIRKRADELEVSYVKEHGVPVKKGLFEVLERFKRNEVLLAVATSSKRIIAEEYLRDADVYKYFDVVICGDEVVKGKPDPQIFLKAASGINCQPESCLIFEDSENGLLAASRAGGLPIYIKDIKDARPDIKEKAWLPYESMTEFLQDLRLYTKKYPLPTLNEHFPQNNNQLAAGIHGFGAIGGGYLAQVFSHWDGYTRPGTIIGATRNENLRNMVNAFHCYQVNYESLAYAQTIRNVTLIDMDQEDDMISMYLKSDIMALCLPEKAFRKQSMMTAKGLLARKEAEKDPLTILVILNKLHAASYVKKQIKKALLELTSEQIADEILSETYFCETVVNRMVSAIPKEELLKQIQRKLNSFKDSVADTEHLKKSVISLKGITRILKDISYIQTELSRVNLELFRSEPDMTLYVGGTSPVVPYLRQVKIMEDIFQMQVIKNRLSNGTHAIIAWYCSLLGYKSIGQGMGDERILSFVKRMMEEEIKPTLIQKNPDYEEYINTFTKNFIKRCRFSFKDPVTRVGRDPIRKLQHKERILGTMAMVNATGTACPLLEFGAALGFYYGITLRNPEDRESITLRNLYRQTESIEKVLTYQGTLEGKPCRFLDPETDKEAITRISVWFHKLMKESISNPA
ncbi:HAD family hydrolase [Clostridium sp. E02]|uniref:bifunctional mannitol-1-phosphate dehydrogenase/phosphatase n=1 Tax=Clostridium sp. E02 TaxID=2487134 RepID=UPI000F51E0E3|nr:HAD family hydrolase [Clostridium sp. E02]